MTAFLKCMAVDFFFFFLVCICGWILQPNKANLIRLVMETYYRKASLGYSTEVTKPFQDTKAPNKHLGS